MQPPSNANKLGGAFVVFAVIGALLSWLLVGLSRSPAHDVPQADSRHAPTRLAAIPQDAIPQESPRSAREAILAQQFVGTVRVVEDATGGRAYSCQVVLVSITGSQQLIDAPAGTWTGPLPAEEFRVVGVRGDGIVPTFAASAALSQSVPRIEIVISKPDSWTLSVIDEATRSDINAIELWAVDDLVEDPDGLFKRNKDMVPKEGVHRLVNGGTSPCEVPELGSTGLYWVRAPGYATQTFERNQFQRAARVELYSEGLLSVDLMQSVVDLAEHARVDELDVIISLTASHSGRALWSTAVTGQAVRETRPVRVGTYTLTASLRGRDYFGTPFFTREVHIASQEHVRIAVDVVDPDRAGLAAPLGVVVVLPAMAPEVFGLQMLSWSEQDGSWQPRFLRQDLHDWTSLDDGRARSFLLRSVPQGRHKFRVTPTGHEVEYEHHAGVNSRMVVIDCSDTAEVSVLAIGPLRQDKRLAVEWSYLGAAEQGGGRVVVDADTGEARVICLPRPIRLHLVGAALRSEEVTVEPHGGERTTVTLGEAMNEFAYLRMTVWANGSHAFLEPSFWQRLSVEAVGHEGRLVQIDFGTQGTSAKLAGSRLVVPDFSRGVLVLSAPGQYRLVGPESWTRAEVDVPAGISDYALFQD